MKIMMNHQVVRGYVRWKFGLAETDYSMGLYDVFVKSDKSF